jgi:hypothetical protein
MSSRNSRIFLFRQVISCRTARINKRKANNRINERNPSLGLPVPPLIRSKASQIKEMIPVFLNVNISFCSENQDIIKIVEKKSKINRGVTLSDVC